MLDELKARLEDASTDKQVKVLILGHTGSVFSAGHDLKELVSLWHLTNHFTANELKWKNIYIFTPTKIKKTFSMGDWLQYFGYFSEGSTNKNKKIEWVKSVITDCYHRPFYLSLYLLDTV